MFCNVFAIDHSELCPYPETQGITERAPTRLAVVETAFGADCDCAMLQTR
jgi:hypothetical protein